MTHHKTSGNLFPVTRRSVMVTEAKGDGTPLGKFISDRLANISRFSSEKETMQLVFKAFKFILQVQMHHLETEGAFLRDLHENNITVMSDGNGGPFRRAVCLRGCFGAPDSQRASACEKRSYQSPFVVFLEYLVNCQSRQGPQESLVCLCDAGLGSRCKRPPTSSAEIFAEMLAGCPSKSCRGLQRDVDDIQQKFLDGVSMQDQCRIMKQEAMQAAISRQFRKECVWEDAWNPPSIPPGTKAECQQARAKAECHQNKAECRFLTALLLARQWCNKKPGPGLFLLLVLPPWVQQGQVPQPKPLKKAPPTARVVKPGTDAKKSTSLQVLWSAQQGQQGPPTFAKGPGQAWILQKAPPPELPKEAKKPPPPPPPEEIQQQQPAQVVQPVKKPPPPPLPQEIQQQQAAEVVQQVKKPPPSPPPQRLPPSELDTDKFAISPVETPTPRPSQAPGPPPPAGGTKHGSCQPETQPGGQSAKAPRSSATRVL